MNPKSRYLLLPFCLACSAAWLLARLAHAQDIQADRVSVHLSNPSHPASLKASLKSGGITVKGYDDKEVIVEARFRSRKSSADGKTDPKSESAKTSKAGATGLKVEEENNVVTIGAGLSDRPIDLIIQVPVKTSLNLGCMTNGTILVENVEGEIEASNQSGPVTLTKVSGVVIADSRNGTLLVQLSKVTPNKPMSFSTVNGDIDVTLPADIKAKVKLDTLNGRTESDFEIGLTSRKPTLEAGGNEAGNSFIIKNGGKQLSLFHHVANINGGGAEISFKSVNGNLFLRKGAK
jgi:DUF4097 and DUF4098 domain-containing protein YvlB